MDTIYICEIFFKTHTDGEIFKQVINEANELTYKRKKKELIESLQVSHYVIEEIKESKYDI